MVEGPLYFLAPILEAHSIVTSYGPIMACGSCLVLQIRLWSRVDAHNTEQAHGEDVQSNLTKIG
jgi:hypothetical protein